MIKTKIIYLSILLLFGFIHTTRAQEFDTLFLNSFYVSYNQGSTSNNNLEIDNGYGLGLDIVIFKRNNLFISTDFEFRNFRSRVESLPIGNWTFYNNTILRTSSFNISLFNIHYSLIKGFNVSTGFNIYYLNTHYSTTKLFRNPLCCSSNSEQLSGNEENFDYGLSFGLSYQLPVWNKKIIVGLTYYKNYTDIIPLEDVWKISEEQEFINDYYALRLGYMIGKEL